MYDLSVSLHVQSSLVGQYILIRELRIFQSHRLPLLQVPLVHELYIIYSA